jgi:hypothetical protein
MMMNNAMIRLSARIALLAMFFAIRPAASQDVYYEEKVTLANSSQNIRAMGLCMRASHQEAKGVTVPATIEECANSTWYPYRFYVTQHWYFDTYRYVTIKLRTRQDLCLDVDPATRGKAEPLVVMAPCDTTGAQRYQQWGIVPIREEYGYGNQYVLINAGATSSKRTLVLQVPATGTQLILAQYSPGAWKSGTALQQWGSDEFWCQLDTGRHVDGYVTGRTWVKGERKPDTTWPHCSS